MSTRQTYISLFLIAFIVACAGDTNPFSIMTGSEGELIMVNATGRVIHHMAVNPETLALYSLDRCPDSPDKIESWQERAIAVDEIFGYEAGKEAILYWWIPGKIKENGCYEAARVSTMILTPDILQNPAHKIHITGFTDE